MGPEYTTDENGDFPVTPEIISAFREWGFIMVRLVCSARFFYSVALASRNKNCNVKSDKVFYRNGF